MSHDPSLERLDAWRDQLLDAARPIAAFDGWTAETLTRAERDAGLDAGIGALACPAGVIDLLDFWARRCDEAAAAALEAADLSAMRVRERVAFGVRARVEATGAAHRLAARRAIARLALPDGAARAGAMAWRAADVIWRGIGDRSTDGNFYSKRAILSGVVAGALNVWAMAADDEDDAPWRFLDRRIDNVMTFEKFKARARGWFAAAPSPAEVAASVRYPRRRG